MADCEDCPTLDLVDLLGRGGMAMSSLLNVLVLKILVQVVEVYLRNI